MDAAVAPARAARTSRQQLFRILAVVVGCVALVLGAQDWQRIRATRAIGVSATVDPIASYTKRRSRGSTTYSADFSFKTSAGDTVHRRRTFPSALLADFENSRPVTVVYDPRNPSDFVFEKESASWIPFAMGAGFLVAALVFL